MSSKTLHEFSYSVAINKAKVMDEQIRIVFKRPPRFIPELWWYKLVARFFVIEQHRREI